MATRIEELMRSRRNLTSSINAAFTMQQQNKLKLAYVQEKQPRAAHNLKLKWLQQEYKDAYQACGGFKIARKSPIHINDK